MTTDAPRRAPGRGGRDADALRAARRWAPPSEPRRGTPLGGAIAASAVLHALVAVAFVIWKPAPPRPAPPVYTVQLRAAPPGPRAEGIVASEPPPLGEPAAPTAPSTPAPTPEPPAATPPRATPPAATPAATPSATPPRPTAARPERPAPAPPPRPDPARRPTPPPATPSARPATPAPRAAAPALPTPAPTPRPAAPEPAPAAARAGERTGATAGRGPTGPRAGGGPEGGRGTDVANVDVRGRDFPFPGYLTNIVRQVALRFEAPNRNAALSADVAFLIHRDGSVSNVRIVRRSGVYAFDLEAQGAVEAAGTARAFGPLPDGFRDDVLPVTFTFDPRVVR